MIVNRSYFAKGTLRLAQASNEAGQDKFLEDGTTLEEFIAKYEREAIENLLGYPLSKTFWEQFDTDANGVSTLKGTADEKWGWLLNGDEYSINGVAYKWRGLIYKDTITDNNQYKHSLLAFYIYAKFLEHEIANHSGVGFTAQLAKNSQVVSPRSKIAYALNEYHEHVWRGKGNIVSLRRYLTDRNAEDAANFPDWVMVEPQQQNRYGL